MQLIAWEPEHEEEATVVTVRPNFQDSVHVGYVVGLKKFTEYLTSVLCFTTARAARPSWCAPTRTVRGGSVRPGVAESSPVMWGWSCWCWGGCGTGCP